VTALKPAELAALMPAERGGPSTTHGRAIWRWLRQVGLPTAWPDHLPEAGRATLATLRAQVQLPDVVEEARVQSQDGTVKWRLRCRGAPVETVLIPHDGRSAVCISSQSGCTRSCDFCATARMPFQGHLTAGEMVAQALLARARAPASSPVRSVVFMGMGEPLDNLEEVLRAVDVMEHGMSLGPTHVTVSTSGVLPRMEEFMARCRACLALSLHATTDEQRAVLMPGTRRWRIRDLMDVMGRASRATGRHFFIEYVLLDGVNDTEEDARRLVELTRGVRVCVNLIPFNAIDVERGYRRPPEERVRRFQRVVMDNHVLCVLRQPRGGDAAAGCGQLACLTPEALARQPLA
jgi:23S rRNA (adenine2503-C2)-methyltransferase